MSQDENLYNEDGTLTEAYKKKIEEMEEYVKEHSIAETLKEMHPSEEESAADTVILAFSEKRRDLFEDYHRFKQSASAGEDKTDEDIINEWIEQRLSKSDNSHAKEELETLLEDEIIEELEDKEIAEAIRNIDEEEN